MIHIQTGLIFLIDRLVSWSVGRSVVRLSGCYLTGRSSVIVWLKNSSEWPNVLNMNLVVYSKPAFV